MSLEKSGERAVINRVMWRVMPLLTLCYIIAVIDRSNVGFAKLQMLHGLHMTERTFGFGASLFFIGFLLFEIPSTIAGYRYGARVWFARIMLTWGIATILLGFAFSETTFYVLRFLLGVAEGGLYPFAIFTITLWFPQQHRVRAFAIFQMGGALGNICAGLLSGSLLDLNGTLGLAGWQWVFIVTGIPAILLAIVIYFLLPNRPKDARFLSQDEKGWLEREIARVAPHHVGNPLKALHNKRVLLLALVHILIPMALYGLIYWLPTVIRSFGVTRGTHNGFLSTGPFLLSALLLLTIPATLRNEQRVRKGFTAIALIGMICFVLSAFTTSLTVRYAMLVLGGPCIQLLAPAFWTIATRYFGDAHPATSFAAINCVGTLGGFFAQNLMPAVAHATGNVVYSMFVPAGCLLLLAFVPFIIPHNTEIASAPGSQPAESRP